MTGRAVLKGVAIWIVLALIMSCTKMTTVRSTSTIEGSNLDEVRAIVDRTFGEFTNYHHDPSSDSYLIWGKKNRLGRPVGYVFEVRYKTEGKRIIVQISNTRLAATEDELIAANDYLSRIVGKIDERLKEAGAKATVEIGSSWVPALYK